jgi:DNA integrity scanning protein DisA with diadenylate cyclase activity
MLDKLGKKIIKALKAMCNIDSYSILEINEILTELSQKIDVEVFTKYIEYLVENGYIDVKYIDQKQICLALLPKAKNIDEENKVTKSMIKRNAGFVTIVAIVSAICGFVGAFLGSMLYGVIN